MTIYGITTKFGIRMCLFQCAKFQGNKIMHYNNFHTFTKRRKKKRKEKTEEIKPIFKSSYLVNARCDLVEI